MIQVCLLVICTTTHAQYIDSIDIPAQKIASSQYSLLLDVVNLDPRLVAVGERGHILTSDDQGKQWHQADVSSSAHLNAVFFADKKHGWAVGEDGIILNSQDGGLNWQHQFDQRDAEQKGPLLDVYFSDTQHGFATGVFNKIYHTADGGKTWFNWQEHIDNLDEWHLFALAASDVNNIYIASEMGLIFRSADNGQSFEPLQTDHDGSFHGILARTGATGNDELVLFGVGGVVYTSIDGGEEWQQIDTGIEEGLSGGSWTKDGSAVLVGMNGVQLTLSADLQQVDIQYSTSGYPANAIAQISEQEALTVGIGGIQSLPVVVNQK